MKIKAHPNDLNVWRDLQRPLEFFEDIWNAFYKSKVQLKAMNLLEIAKDQEKRAGEAGKFGHDLKEVEAKVAACQRWGRRLGHLLPNSSRQQ